MRSWRFTIFLFLALAAIFFFYCSGMILSIFIGRYLGNIPVKFESHWPKGFGGDSILSKLFKLFYF